jgi:hypothetical protein
MISNKLRIELPAPHAAQRQVLAEAKRFNVLACGRRWGKSTLGVDRIIKPVLALPLRVVQPHLQNALGKLALPAGRARSGGGGP